MASPPQAVPSDIGNWITSDFQANACREGWTSGRVSIGISDNWNDVINNNRDIIHKDTEEYSVRCPVCTKARTMLN